MAERPKRVWPDGPAGMARRAVPASRSPEHWRDNVGYWAAWCAGVIGIWAGVGWLVVPHVDAEKTLAALAEAGYRESVVTGRRWRGCPHASNFYRTGFHAVGPTGTLFEGVGCAGPFSGRVRIKVRSWRPPAPATPPDGPSVWTSDVLAVTSLAEQTDAEGRRILDATVVNRTGAALGWVFVSVERRDAAGHALDTILATTGSVGGAGLSSLWPGHTWHVRLPVPSAGTAALRVVDAGDV